MVVQREPERFECSEVCNAPATYPRSFGLLHSRHPYVPSSMPSSWRRSWPLARTWVPASMQRWSWGSARVLGRLDLGQGHGAEATRSETVEGKRSSRRHRYSLSLSKLHPIMGVRVWNSSAPPQGSSFSCTGGVWSGSVRRCGGRPTASQLEGPPPRQDTRPPTPRGHRKCLAYLVPGRTPTLTEPTSAPLDAVVRQLDALD